MGRLADDAARFGVALSADQEAQFARLAEALLAWNAHTNLTAITEPEGVRVRHFLDSLTVPVRPDERVIDVGTGAGFPGLPLAIAHPTAHITLLEATGKKIAFLEYVIGLLGLTNAAALHARAEEAGQHPDHRAAYDLAVARAVARLPTLLEYLLPLVRVGGRCIAMKGITAHEEAESAKRALRILGGRLISVETVSLPEIDEPHYLVIVEKTEPTSPAYPRRPGTPSKKPL
jgi:16S rRNA (guanine527-N7)-methyltransferase